MVLVNKNHLNRLIWLLPLVVFLSFVVPSTTIRAEQTVKRMGVDVALDKQGTATFTENWTVTADEGSEIYKTINLVGPQELSNYQVSMDGHTFKRVNTWNPDADRKQKAYRYGQNEDELNWGITKYGTHHYKIQYKVTNFVEQTKTKQMIAWQFLNRDVAISPQHLTIKLHDDNKNFAANKGYGIWGFGFEGNTKFSKGDVLIKNTKPLDEDNRVKIIMKLPRHTYATANKSERSFDSYIKEAFKGSSFDYDKYKAGKTETEKSFSWDWLWDVAYVTPLVIVIYFSVRGVIKKRKYQKYYPSLKKLTKETQGQYERELPTENIWEAYAFIASLVDKYKLAKNYCSVMVLSLMKRNLITLSEVDDETVIHLNDTSNSEQLPSGLAKFYDILQTAAEDGEVTNEMLASYFKDDFEASQEIWRLLLSNSNDYGEQHKLIYPIDQYQTHKKSETKANKYAQIHNGSALTPDGLAVRKDFVRLKNYLQDFTLLEERTPKEVGLWDDLMLAAAALGIAEQVATDLEKIYPAYREESIYYQSATDPFHYAYAFSTQSLMSDTDSSGSGGFTSSGGGGSFGGGSGGGGFR